MYGKLENSNEEFDYALRRARPWWRGILNFGIYAFICGGIAYFGGVFGNSTLVDMGMGGMTGCCIGAGIYFVIFCIKLVQRGKCDDAEDIERYKKDLKRGKYKNSPLEDELYGV